MAGGPVTPSPGCDPVRATAYVDGALSAAERLEVEAHLAACPTCQAQVESERMIAAALRGLPAPPMPHGLAARVRRRSRKPIALRRRVWIPSLAAMLLLVLLGRGSAQFVAWEVALDHAHCFGKRQVPAEVLTADPMRLTAWFEAQGTELPLVPLRELVVFPKLVMPLGAGREKSVNAINAAMSEEKHYILLAAQKDAEIDDVAPDQIHSVGTIAEIVRLLRIPDGSAQIIVQGIERVRITGYADETRYFKAQFDVLPDVGGEAVETEALLLFC